MDKPTTEHRDSMSPSELEKENGGHMLNGVLLPPDPDAGKSDEEKARILAKLQWKIDMKLIPWLCLLYLASFLDRTNIGNAKIDGLVVDLGMTDGQYTASLSIFFVSYALFEPLTNVMLKRFKPSIFLPIIMILWGACMTLMGLVHNAAGLMAARWFLGMTEAALFPGCQYYLSCWYKRSQFGIRSAIFFSAAAVAGSFGGLLAAAIAKMDGVGGKPGWAWIFILEGLATVIIAVASFWMVQDFPAEATFLSEDDRSRVIRMLAEDQQASARHEEFETQYLWQALKDWKTYTSAVIYMGCDGALYAFSLFLPTIILELGYTSTRAQLLSVAPYAVAALLTIIIGFIADRTQQRGLCNIGVSLLGIIGFSMLLGAHQPGVKYAAVFFGAMGIYPCVANTISWAANNTEGVYKRGVVLGVVIGWGNLNGVVSSNIYRAKDKPKFIPGHSVVLAYMVVFLLGGSIVQYLGLKRENAKRRAGLRDSWVDGLGGDREEELRRRGDKRPDFIYTL